LDYPDWVDCNAEVIVVSESEVHCISVLSWTDGKVLTRFGGWGMDPGRLKSPFGIRLLASGNELVVADRNNHRLCVFTLNCDFVSTVDNKEKGLRYPHDVVECTSDGGFVATNFYDHNLVKLNRDGAIVEVYGKKGDGNCELNCPIALTALPGGGLVVREFLGARLQIFHGLELRKAWVIVCVTVARYGYT
jgi:hypothetical protein